MGVGFSLFSSTDQEILQEAQSKVAQNISGTCNMICSNYNEGTTIELHNTTVKGNIEITQKCTNNSTCSITSTLTGSSVIYLEGIQSDTFNPVGQFIYRFFDRKSQYYHQIIENEINQEVNNVCNITSINQFKDTHILATDSLIKGDIVIEQNATTGGGCVIDTTMTADAVSTGIIKQETLTGKGEKKGCSSSSTILWIVIIIGVLLVIFATVAIFKAVSKKKNLEKGLSVQKSPQTDVNAALIQELLKRIPTYSQPPVTSPVTSPVTESIPLNASQVLVDASVIPPKPV